MYFFSFTHPGWTVVLILMLNGSNDVLKDDPLGVWTMSDVILGKCASKTPQKRGVNTQFQPKHQNLSIAISPELLIQQTSDMRMEFRPGEAFRGWSAITPNQIQHRWRPPSWKSIWRHITRMGGPIWTKFGSLMQNNTPITATWSRSKPEIEFQYGGRLFFQTGSSNISAMNGDISTKFGLLIGFDLLKAQTWTIMKPEVVLSGSGRHVAKSVWLYITESWDLHEIRQPDAE